MRKSQERLNKKLLKNLDLAKTLLNTGMVLAVTISITGSAFAVPTSNSLPVPNYVNGANLQYSSGLNINNNAGDLNSTVQTNAANAANSSSKLNVDLGSTVNNVADLRYNSFNIGNGKTVNFNFGASGQAALNRVNQVGDQYASRILGSITQSGQGGAIFLINPNGVLFGAKSRVNVNSLTVSTLDLVPDDKLSTLTLARGSNAPKGILFEKGAQINASKSALFVANGILDKGANITSCRGNVQMVTGDGATINYSNDYAANQIPIEDITRSTATPDQVVYPNGEINKNNAISIKGGIIKGNNVEIVTRIDKTLDNSLPKIVNIDGVIRANKVNNSGGSILVYADNSANTDNNKSVGIKVNTNLNADADIQLQADQIVAKDIKAGRNLRLFGDIIKTYRLCAGENAFIGKNASDSLLTEASNTIITSINAGNDIKLVTKSGSVGNLTAEGNIDIEATSVEQTLGLNKIKAEGDVLINTTGTKITTGNICAGNDAILNAFFSGSITSGNISAGRDVSVIADIEASTNIKNIYAGRNVFVGAFNAGSSRTGDIKAKGNVTLSSAEGFVSVGNICAGNNVLFDEFLGNVTSGDIKAGGNLTAGLLDSIAHAGNITLGGGLDFDLNGSAFFTGNIKVANDVNINGTGSLTTGNIKVGGDFTANLDLNSTLTTGNICVGHDLTVGLESSILNTGNIFAGNNIKINAFGETITLKNVSAGGDILISEAQGATTLGNIKAGGSATLSTSEGPLTADNISAGVDVTVTAVDNSTVKVGNISARNNVTLNSILDSNITTGNICAGNDVTLNKQEGGTITTGKIHAGGLINN